MLVKLSSNYPTSVAYFIYGKIGHKYFTCNSRKLGKLTIKKVWVPKATIIANLQGTKKAWISTLKT